MNVRLRGAWEDWLAFYLAGVEDMAKESAETADRVVKTFAADRRKQVFSYHAYWKLLSKGMGNAE